MNVDTRSKLDEALALDLLRRMTRVRTFEARVGALAAAGELPGAVHLSIGQEAVAAGVCAALRDDDYVTSNHRGHGHILSKGGDVGRCMAELFARETGYCRGKGGSMHLASIDLGIIGANGIVGSGLPVATGAALSAKLRGSGQVSVCFFGDGAANEGAFHESLNLAAIWSLPVVYVCENNGWGELTPMQKVTARGTVVYRADGYGIPGVAVDGNDAFAVHATVSDAVERARRGEGPTLIEAITYRIREHAEGLERIFGKASTEEQLAHWGSLDPVDRVRSALEDAGVDAVTLDALTAEIEAEIDAAVEFAQASPKPPPESAFEDMWTDVPGGVA